MNYAFKPNTCSSTHLATRVQNAQAKIKLAQDKFEQTVLTMSKKLNQVKDQGIRINKNFQTIKSNYEKQMQIKVKQQASILVYFKKAIEGAINRRKQSQNKIYRYLQQKICKCGEQLAQQSKNRNQSIDGLQQTIEHDLPKLQKMLTQLKKSRECNDRQVIHAVGQQIRKANDFLVSNRQIRKKKQSKIYDMVRQFASKIRNQLEQQQKARIYCHQSLFELIEQACSKLQCTTV